ncbi:unnamed protein product [Notodromas monacha]|uniref:Drebrin-like protein n=1 Tax=Notodromas monacha TaxID=399045 RepID=A0A7R9BSN5_9CRUS|nr:unnamed protein product [Notodromas monacha]CAG0920677.1 unnamed protein product [Notodromas monacha]
MALDVDKHKSALIDAWKKVLDEKDPTDWALFGYEGPSNSLKCVSTGDGGIEELLEDFNSSLIMYAFCRVMDPKTSLPKFVIINWQGEAAPAMRKGLCANHIPHVASFFRGSQLSITARTEDDVDPEVVLETVSKATASAYQFQTQKSDESEVDQKVGTAYKRIIPTRDINKSEREKFWEQQEAEEKKRLEEEQRKRESDLKRLEEERNRREVAEAKAREERVRERVRAIKQIKEAEADKSHQSQRAEKAAWERKVEEDEKDAADSVRRSRDERRMRDQETKQIIGRRVSDSRSIFEQNSAAGQLNARQSNGLSSPTAAAPKAPSPQRVSPLPANNVINNREPERFVEDVPVQRIMTNVAVEREEIIEVKRPYVEPEPEVEEPAWTKAEELISAPVGFETPAEPTKRSFEEQYAATVGQGLRARTLYDYQAADDTEISFDPDDIICRIDQIDEGWWQGLGPSGDYGLFPANYVQLLED